MVTKTKEKETFEKIESVRGGFCVIAGLNGDFKEYKAQTLQKLKHLFETINKKTHVINFNIADELNEFEKEAYLDFNIKPRIHHNSNAYRKKIKELNESRNAKINVIGMETGLDHIIHHVEKRDIDLYDIRRHAQYWIGHGRDSPLRHYDIKAILLDATYIEKFKKHKIIIEEYMDVHNEFSKSSYKIIRINDKNPYSKNNDEVVRELFRLFNPYFV